MSTREHQFTRDGIVYDCRALPSQFAGATNKKGRGRVLNRTWWATCVGVQVNTDIPLTESEFKSHAERSAFEGAIVDAVERRAPVLIAQLRAKLALPPGSTDATTEQTL